MSDLAAFIAFVVQDLVALSSDPLVGEVYECRVQDHLVNLVQLHAVSRKLKLLSTWMRTVS